MDLRNNDSSQQRIDAPNMYKLYFNKELNRITDHRCNLSTFHSVGLRHVSNYMSNVLNLQVITVKPDNMVNKPISRQRNADESMRHV